MANAVGVLAMALLGIGSDPALEVEPAVLRLDAGDAAVQVVVTGRDGRGRPIDRTTAGATFAVEDPTVAAADATGRVRPIGDGTTWLRVRVGGVASRVPVIVEGLARDRIVRFAGEVVPIFSRYGCNAGGCHGKASGQNGFRLSLLGYDPRLDFEAVAVEGRGRRVFPAAPERSLLWLKATGRVPHGGGRKLDPDSPEARTIARWIGQGMPFSPESEPRAVALEVYPASRILEAGGTGQLRVTARYDDGTVADVTRLAQYGTNAAELAVADERGRVTVGRGVGEAALMARFAGLVAVSRATVPRGGPSAPDGTAATVSENPVDGPIAARWAALGLSPSGRCTDAEFARRAMLDLCGRLPTPEEALAFEADGAADKRARLVDRLIDRPEYADTFAMKWSAILRNKRALFSNGGDPGSYAFHAWIRQALATNLPYDRFVRAIVAARGEVATHPPVAFFRTLGKAEDAMPDDVAQLFLGQRLQCAKCHHHPFERWSQDDYYGFAAFFARVGRKPGGADAFTPRVFATAAGKAKHPASGREYDPKPLDSETPLALGPRDDPRDALVDWMAGPDNPFFARSLVNRYWKHFLGRGLVEPEDDLRATNPPTNPELLDALSADFVASGFDLKRLVRTIATSECYGLSSAPTPGNAEDKQAYARFYPRRLPAEVLLDALGDLTGVPDTFNGLPQSFRAVELPDDGVFNPFLEVFGRPKRMSVCECERSAEANLAQSLQLLGSKEMQDKLAGDKGRAAALAAEADKAPDAEKVTDLYRRAFARAPTDDERQACLDHLARRRAEGRAREGFEDLIATLANTKEFQFNH